MNKTLFRSQMVLNRDTYTELAKVLGISYQSVCAKVNGNGPDFRQREIAKIVDRYNLTPEQTHDIFFAQ